MSAAQAPLEAAVAAHEADFALLGDWEDRYAHVIDLGRRLPPLEDAVRTEANRVLGCASQVWLAAELVDGRLRLRGDSDAAIVRGLVALMLSIYGDRTPAEILALDPQALFKRLGLEEALTPQRSNGLKSLVGRIRAHAQAALAGKR